MERELHIVADLQYGTMISNIISLNEKMVSQNFQQTQTFWEQQKRHKKNKKKKGKIVNKHSLAVATFKF